MDLKSAIVAYSLPNSNEFLLATISGIEERTEDTNLQDYDFIIAPFDKKLDKSILIKFSSVSANRVFSIDCDDRLGIESTSFDDYARSFRVVHDQILDGQLDKTILSRRKVVETDTSNLYDRFIHLKNAYLSAFTYLIHIPSIGTWMGATPELLAEVKGQVVHTKAIAGTQAYDEGSVDDVKWSNKEVKEHQFIEQFIREEFPKDSIQISPTYTVAAGKVCHICSDIVIDTEDSVQDTIDLIHPGPALSGMPKGKATELIRHVEPTGRALYCGYLGPISKSSIHLFVNIRCMQIFKDACCLYLGGGITKESILEDEWQETELKARTLESIISLQSQHV